MNMGLNEEMKRCHQDNGFQDQFLHPLLRHQQQGCSREGLGLFHHPYPYLFDIFGGPKGHYLFF
jgi:hypothetical protein